MSGDVTENSAVRFQVKLTSDSHFSWVRTRMAVESTLMSWVRTSISLIGFGFTIVQFFARFNDMKGVAEAVRPDAPRYVGLAMIAAGVLGLLVSLWQYRWLNRYLWSEPFTPLAGINSKTQLYMPIVGVAILLILIGMFAFVAVLTRMV
jgi:putative membrane protein